MEALELACAQPIGRVRVAWNATLGLSFIIVICAIAAAAANDADPRGNKGAGFAGVWCIFVLFLVGINGACPDRTVMSSIAHRARGAARARDVSDDSRRPRPAAAPGPSAPRVSPGSIVLLKTRSALMVGVLMGSAVMMSQLCFSERARSVRRAPPSLSAAARATGDVDAVRGRATPPPFPPRRARAALFAVFIGLARQAETTGTNDDDESAEGSDRALAAFFFMQFACYSAFCVALFMYRHDVIEDRADGALDRGMPPDVTSTPVAPSQERSTEPAAVGV